jgi:hypothetical protein
MRALREKAAITIGGNRGIGLAVAMRFVAEKAFVFNTGRRPVSIARRSSSYSQRVRVVSGGRGPSANSGVPVNFGIENWTHAFSKNGPTHVTIAIVAWDMRSRRMLLCTSENAQPGTPAKILAFMVAPQARPVVEGK